MMPSGILERLVTISLQSESSGAHIFLRCVCEKGTRVKSGKEECGFETCHDKKAYRRVGKGPESQTQEPLAIFARGGSRSKLTW